MTVEDAQAAVDEITGDLASARAAHQTAQGEVRGLELRVADGDATVQAIDLVNARHAAEVHERRVAKLTGQLQGAREALDVARAHRVVDGWEGTAPSLRAQIREAAIRLVAARDEIERLVAAHNDGSLAVQRALQGTRDPGGRWAMATFGHRFAGTESLRPLHAEAIVAASLTRKRSEVPPELPRDVLPHGPQVLPGSLARRHPDPVSRMSSAPLTETQQEEAISAGARTRVQRSPFFRRRADEEA